MIAALRTESLKFFRSWAPWATGTAFLLPIVLACLFVTTSGIAGDKSRALGITADWSGFRTALMQVDAAGGFLLFGVLVTWMFGREFSDRTVLDLLALPTSRTAIVVAKFTISTTWLLTLGLLQIAAWLAAGTLLDLPGDPDIRWEALPELLLLLAFNIALTVPVALAASMGRGYLPGVAATTGLLIAGVAAAMIGGIGWFPWAAPATLGGLTGATSLSPVSLLTVAATATAGVAGTALWWRRADH